MEKFKEELEELAGRSFAVGSTRGCLWHYLLGVGRRGASSCISEWHHFHLVVSLRKKKCVGMRKQNGHAGEKVVKRCCWASHLC